MLGGEGCSRYCRTGGGYDGWRCSCRRSSEVADGKVELVSAEEDGRSDRGEMEGNWLQVVDERTRSEPRNAIHAAMRANTLTLSSKYSSPSRSGAEPTGPTLRQPTPTCPPPPQYPVQLAAGHSRHTRARGAASNSPCTTACSRRHGHAAGRDTAAEWCRLVCHYL